MGTGLAKIKYLDIIKHYYSDIWQYVDLHCVLAMINTISEMVIYPIIPLYLKNTHIACRRKGKSQFGFKILVNSWF